MNAIQHQSRFILALCGLFGLLTSMTVHASNVTYPDDSYTSGDTLTASNI